MAGVGQCRYVVGGDVQQQTGGEAVFAASEELEGRLPMVPWPAARRVDGTLEFTLGIACFENAKGVEGERLAPLL
jgi:hypothetical protein